MYGPLQASKQTRGDINWERILFLCVRSLPYSQSHQPIHQNLSLLCHASSTRNLSTDFRLQFMKQIWGGRNQAFEGRFYPMRKVMRACVRISDGPQVGIQPLHRRRRKNKEGTSWASKPSEYWDTVTQSGVGNNHRRFGQVLSTNLQKAIMRGVRRPAWSKTPKCDLARLWSANNHTCSQNVRTRCDEMRQIMNVTKREN